MLKNISLLVLAFTLIVSCTSQQLAFTFSAKPDTKEDVSLAAVNLIKHLQSRTDTTHITVIFSKGRYDFYPDSAFTREYYISNHDQDNPKKVGFALENLSNVTFDGQGSEFVFHGRMIPFSLIKGKNIMLKNVSIDFDIPAFRQINVLEVSADKNEMIAEIYPHGRHRIDGNKLFAVGEGYENPLFMAMAFRPDKRLTYMRRDVDFNPETISEQSPDTLHITGWEQTPLSSVGERFALRSWHRPTPGIFVSECSNIVFKNIKVHYAEGMGLLAQMSENITLDGFSVCLKSDDNPRFFTTQADATHFSACKGTIISKNGLYEGMADDAINVHGTYLRVIKRVSDNTLHARYMHAQAYGFKWGETGDSVQFVESEKMELVGNPFNTTIKSIKAIDKPTEVGAKEFEITFMDVLPQEISETGKFGIENLTWTPNVIFSDNTIRNNRARGALFSTPRSVICENNLFDHTHGTAILLCGDCNGWFETGACRDVVIRNNKFINALTATYQFTNAIISIYPEIPNLKDQQKFFHSGIVIENNTFDTFDRPLLYAKSTDGLIFRNNTIKHNTEFKPFHWNKHPFFFEKVANISIENNTFSDDFGFDKEKGVRVELSDDNAIIIQ
ncbi:MAG: right-handed parallel beta-helix repeat-containing protein [Bacteroidia bacterium]|nr:right-handed parallel beta-helix repeat-containing protein [Bacteroidia bacterium]